MSEILSVSSGKSLAQERWKILKSAIVAAKRRQTDQNKLQGNLASVRRFSGFGLFKMATLSKQEPSMASSSSTQDDLEPCENHRDHPNIKQYQGKWFQYEHCVSAVGSDVHISPVVKHLTETTSLEDMMGFNNTGNVCVWPAEEVLAHYCLRNAEMFEGKVVCELGCGMTALAGVMLACTQCPSEVLLTDGNSVSVDNVKEILKANSSKFGRTLTSADVLIWDKSFLDKPSPYDSRFDYLICADCLFFTEVHHELAQVMLKLLKPNGKVVVFVPKRSGTLDQFCTVARKYFGIECSTQYDDLVWQKHTETLEKLGNSGIYSPDLHYPLYLTLQPL